MSGAQPYDYARRQGIERISWERFVAMARELAQQLAGHEIEAVVGIARAGLMPAALIACALRVDLFPVQVTRRENDQVVRRSPRWKVDVSEEVRGRRLAVVDEIADSGETLALVAARARQLGAKDVCTAALVSHTWADPRPQFYAFLSDALIVFPWDASVYIDGTWQLHPELRKAMDEL